MGRVVHFEIHAADPDRAEAFYAEVFGWQVQRWEGQPVDYRLVTTGPREAPGVDGALTMRDAGGPGADAGAFVCTIEVDDLAATDRAIAGHGGTRLTDPQEIPGVGRHAYYRDPDGNVFGALQPAPAG